MWWFVSCLMAIKTQRPPNMPEEQILQTHNRVRINGGGFGIDFLIWIRFKARTLPNILFSFVSGGLAAAFMKIDL